MAINGLGQPNGIIKDAPSSPKHANGHANGGLAHAEPDLTGEIVVFEVDDESLHNVRSKPKILQDSLVRTAVRNIGLILIWCVGRGVMGLMGMPERYMYSLLLSLPTGTFSVHCSAYSTKSSLAVTMDCGGTAGFLVRMSVVRAMDALLCSVANDALMFNPLCHSAITICMYPICCAALLGARCLEPRHCQATCHRHPLMVSIFPLRCSISWCCCCVSS